MAKIALLIGVSDYPEGLNPLPSATKDIMAVQRVLQNSEIGGFDEVKVLSNPEPMAMQEAIEALFSGRSKEDLALLFFSGHGVKDDSGRLYFATHATRKNPNGELVKATAVPASFVQDIMSNARCKRQVVILDCCFSGAFAEGMTAKDDGIVDIQAQLGGEGRAVLTSSTSTQYSFEQQGSDLSVYTQYIVEGLESGAADLDSDGAISIDELHDYARKKVQETAPAMKPKIYVVEEGFKIRLATVRMGDPKVAYRKEVERRASRGSISSIGRRILDDLRENLALNREEAMTIEEEVLKPYREYQKKLQRYEQAFAETIKQEHPLSDTTREELQRYQEILGLRDEDIAPIEDKHSPQVSSNIKPPAVAPEATQPPKVSSSRIDIPQNIPSLNTQIEAPWPQQEEKVSTGPHPGSDRPVHPPTPATPANASPTATPSTKISVSTGVERNSIHPRSPNPVLLWGITGVAITFTGLIVTAIVLPSFLNQATKAKQSEAKAFIGSMNRAQMAYFLESNKFASDVPSLGLGISPETINYRYNTQAFNSGNSSYAISTATPKDPKLKSYVGGTFVAKVPGTNEYTTLSILCESAKPSTTPPAPPKLINSDPVCAAGSELIQK